MIAGGRRGVKTLEARGIRKEYKRIAVREAEMGKSVQNSQGGKGKIKEREEKKGEDTR